MKLSAFARIAAVAGLVWLVVGCNDKWQEPERRGCEYWAGPILQMSTDTLVCWQGDMASVDGSVLVTDCYGEPEPGVHVGLSISNPFGTIEFTDSYLRDTTKQDGRVDFRYLLNSAPTAGSQIITTTVSGKSSQWVIVFGQSEGIPYRATMAVDPDTIHLTGVPLTDYTRVSVIVSDSGNNPPSCSGFSLPIWVNQGVVDPYPPLDSTGATTAIWYPPQYPGLYYIHALHDSALVVVDTLHQ